MSGPELITLGCRLNIAESAAIAALAGDQDDLVVVNSCAVTAEAVRQSRKAIRRARQARPEARIVVTGCAAQIEPETFARMPEVTWVIGNAEKFQPASFRRRPSAPQEPPAFAGITDERVLVSDIMAVRETAPHLVGSFSDRSRAFIEVQNGCDHRCTFCIIPYGRGNSRSVPAGLVIDRIKALVDEGFREVVLTGVDVTSYGPDLPGAPSLGLLVERILRHAPELPRLRLSSLDSVEIDDRLFDLLTGEARLMPHLHLSLQAGDDMILKRMKRRHSRAEAVAMVERLKARRPEIAIGADLIAGFPTESDAMFANSLALIDDCDIVHGHIFPYSPREGTPAARMPQVEPQVARARAKMLRAAGDRRRTAWLRGLVGSVQNIVVERSGETGHAENFAMVRLAAKAPAGSIVAARITGLSGATLTGLPA
jgi:threonylcarbamoyladenosine tRNA methylthiotransferase MtaB